MSGDPSATEPEGPTVTVSDDDEERLGHRKSFWGRMRNRLGFIQVPTRRADEGMGAIGLQGDNPHAGFHG